MNTRAQLLSALLLTIVLGGLVFFIRQSPPPPATKARPAAPPKIQPSAAIVSNPSSDEPRHYRPTPVSDDVRRKVDDFIRRHKDLPAEELAKREEFSALLGRFLQRLDTPEFERKIEERIEIIKITTGIEHGTLSFGAEKLDSPEGRAWLEAMFADDTQRLEDFILNKLDGSIFEFAFDPTLEKTGEGVTVKGNVPVPPTANKLPD